MFVPQESVLDAREIARRRRQAGTTLKLIAADLDVSISSVHNWTRDIELTLDQRRRNRSRPGGCNDPRAVAARASTWRRVSRNKRLIHQRQGRLQALEGDPLHLAGCMVYWAEGSKNRDRVVLANSDVAMARLFKTFMVECFDISDDRFTVRLNVYTNNGLSIREIENNWLAQLELPRSCLRKHQLNHTPTSSSGKRKAKLPYGVCTLCVTRSMHLVQHIFGAIQEYGGFEEPRWLD